MIIWTSHRGKVLKSENGCDRKFPGFPGSHSFLHSQKQLVMQNLCCRESVVRDKHAKCKLVRRDANQTHSGT